jgi:5-methyltetrahydropteroyltriglutamate--homocysteine methyltransferase
MRLSTDRILTTHAGSLPRPDDLLETLYDRSDGRQLSAEANAKIQSAVTQAVRQQADAGIDIIDDGEVGKSGFIGYVNSRLDGFEVDPDRVRGNPWKGSREQLSFPDYYDQGTNTSTGAITTFRLRASSLRCIGPIKYKGQKQLQGTLAT